MLSEPEPFEPRAGVWWRFDRYAIEERDGILYVGPGEGAKLDAYDFWAEDGIRRKSAGYTSPVQDLLEVPKAHKDRGGWTKYTRGLLVEWCQEYGLLGLLLDRTEQMRTAPYWRPPAADGRLVPAFAEYWQATGGWRYRRCEIVPFVLEKRKAGRSSQAVSSRFLPNWSDWAKATDPKILSSWQEVRDRREVDWASLGAEPEAYMPVPLELIRSAPSLSVREAGERDQIVTLPVDWEPAALVRQEGSQRGRLRWEPLTRTWARYFPTTDADAPYPPPLGEDFWSIYMEPLEEVLEAAWYLQKVRDRLQGGEAADGAVQWLEDRALGSGLGIEPAGGGIFRQRRYHRSLLGALALLELYELEDKRTTLRECRVCGHAFWARSRRAEHCGNRCKWREDKRPKGGKP